MHTIDDASRGADGVRLADIDGDGRRDIVTGWEEGGVVRVCLNPGPSLAKRRWPAFTVGRVDDLEDAVLVDLDGDGALDVVSAAEGATRRLSVHWSPAPAKRKDPDAWTTAAFPVSLTGRPRPWMFTLPLQLDGREGPDLVVGAKNDGGVLGWLEAPAQPRDLAAWRWHPLAQAGWIMSILGHDFNGDGEADLLISDRKGPDRGVSWLENPGPGPLQDRPWRRHPIGAQDVEVMFLTQVDLDHDRRLDIVAAANRDGLVYLRRRETQGLPSRGPSASDWETQRIALPPNTGTAKAVAAGDLDGDGRLDLAVTCENAQGDRVGVLWLERRENAWVGHDVSGSPGTKYDLVELIDLDADGDLDLLTCEERDNLGVIWYENPRR